ncbi:MAG TPA: hypothetical protein VLH40_06485, partial [Atribacteraceae bacterium]|nr:hypothetical protein [Atribacteraceae bacterium]
APPLSPVLETDPARVEIPLRQHAGETAKAVVRAGELVREGTLLGEIPEGMQGARTHASIDGRVVLVDEERVIIQKENIG